MIYGGHHPEVIDNHIAFLPFRLVYAHGDLEDKLHYDMVQTNSIELYRSIFHVEYDRKTVESQCTLHDGSVFPVTIIVWRDETFRHEVHGYVVLTSDSHSIRFALEQQTIRPPFI